MRYVYPAIFRPEEGAGFSVFFPDLRMGGTQGDDMAEAMYMAQDFLAGTMYDLESGKKEIPTPSKQSEIETQTGDVVTLVYADTSEYRKKYDNRAINKTLTIPNWLNSLAEDADINFSQILQKALKKELKLQN